MKNRLLLLVLLGFLVSGNVYAQEKVHPSKVSTAVYSDRIESLKDLPTGMVERDREFVRNGKLKARTYPFQTKLANGEDVAWQKTPGTRGTGSILLNFAGQSSPWSPSDCNGTVGPDHFFQGVNCTFAIYNKQTGTKVAGPTDYNTLFSGVTGSSNNDGDPIVLYDKQADRWMVAEFSLGSKNYMLVAVSETNDPTGAWFRYSFLMTGEPDYMKLGIWEDGYYMGTNTYSGNDVYVFQRDVMLAGGSSPKMVQFNNPDRPGTFDDFSMVMPLDADFTAPPAGSPGLFLGLCDDAQNSGYSNDELWVFECDIDWTTTSNSTFGRTQRIVVEDFDTNFGTGWDNIVQKETSQKVDAVPGILMYRAQYRNWGTSQSIVCTHTVDVDGTDHAGIRWYELENTGSGWGVRQQGSYAPDAHSRFQGSIAMNGNHEIAIGYSISSSSLYPGIRIAGQSKAENEAATGIMDIAELTVKDGTQSQPTSVGERWGDYSLMTVDPIDNHTFWFTAEYYRSGKKTQVAAFQLSEPAAVDVVGSEGVRVFPNPSSGVFTVEFENDIAKLVEIYDVSGKKIKSETISEKRFNLNLSDQPKGIYFLNITTNNKTVGTKLVVE